MRLLLKDAHRHPSATASLLIVFMEMIQTYEATRSSSGDFTYLFGQQVVNEDMECHDPLGDLKIIGAEQGRIGRFRERGRRTEPEVDEEDSRTEEMNSVIFQLSSTVPIGGLISFATVLLHGPSPIQQSWPKAHEYI